MSKKKKVALFDLGRVPVTEVKNNSGWESRADFYAREEREERERKERPIREATAAHEAALRTLWGESAPLVKKFWRRPLAELRLVHTGYGSEDLGLQVPTFRDGSQYTFDELVYLFDKWAEEILPTLGYSLQWSGLARLGLYVNSQAVAGRDMSNNDAITAAFFRLLSCDAFETGELSGDGVRPQSKAVAAPAKAPTFDDVAGLNPENREHRKRIFAVVNDNYTTEIAEIFSLWSDHLLRDYGYVMPESVVKKVLTFVTEKNLNPLRTQTWDLVRRTFTKNGLMRRQDGSLMLTSDETLTETIELSNLNSREVRQHINLEHRKILDAGPMLPAHK
jgi:hypothetical protein